MVGGRIHEIFYPFQVPPYLYSANFFASRQHFPQTKTQIFPFCNCIRYITLNSFVQVWHALVFISLPKRSRSTHVGYKTNQYQCIFCL